MKLKTLKPRVPLLKANTLKTLTSRTPSVSLGKLKRMSGRALQEKRRKKWQEDPYCAGCGRLLDFPNGFDMDHIVPLYKGGTHDDSNLQLLCNGPDGCHEAKTREDLKSGGDGYINQTAPREPTNLQGTRRKFSLFQINQQIG